MKEEAVKEDRGEQEEEKERRPHISRAPAWGRV